MFKSLKKIFNNEPAKPKTMSPVDRNLKGKELEKEGKVEEAMSLYWENVNERFDGNFPYDRLTVIYRKQKDYDKEIEVLERAVHVFKTKVNKERADRTPKLEKFEERLAKAKELKG
ncbi:hypothetical protein [Gracilibacillus saliphilus]|uniref:hypothetical protein n=1 Tax=Gracilibacillus saliphilus TaxID=543890 RepID=UPI00192DF6C7|nr:hypothetical protein [Gracilibacillus saliphilus]